MRQGTAIMAKGQSHKRAPARNAPAAAPVQEPTPATEIDSANGVQAQDGDGQAAAGQSAPYRPTPPGGRKKVVPADETPEARAKRLGGPRMGKLLHAFKNVRILTSRGYKLSDAARAKMADDIEREAKETVRALRETSKPAEAAAKVGYVIPD
jgi:hypothetical protein